MECYLSPDESIKLHDSDVNISLRTDSSTAGDIEDVFDTSLECDTDAVITGRCVVPRGRRLDFTRSSRESSPEGNVSTDSIPVIRVSHDDSTDSPPYKRVRALRLMDSPATPKTLLAKSSTPRTPLPARTFLPICREGRFLERLSVVPVGAATLTPKDKPAANVNPFTPTGMLLISKKRRRSALSLTGSPENCSANSGVEVFMDSEDSDMDADIRPAKLALREANIPRYNKEFIEEELIGEGEFGSVYRCTKRLDGIEYAIKKSIKPVTGSSSEKVALNEVYAHAVLGKHPNVVRYFSAWAEDDHMIIQNEYCNGGSLAQAIERHHAQNTHFSETALRRMLRHLAEGLRYIHAMKLVHMDIKPGNIFISTEERLLSVGYESADDNLEEEEANEDVTYKIGDLGHVTSVANPMVEEGDCRYLPMEVLQEKYEHLPKADIFALGLTMFEAAGGGPLPKNGPTWHEIREGKLPELPKYSKDFHALLTQMIDPNPESRPTACALLSHRFVSPLGNQSKAQLLRRLKSEMSKVDILSQKLQQTSQFISMLVNQQQQQILQEQQPGPRRLTFNTRASRAVGKKAIRSQSANCL